MTTTTKSRLLPVLFLAAAAAHAQDTGVSHQREVYRQINDAAARMEKVSSTAPGGNGPVSLTGWLDNGELRKITASPGINGPGFDEFYLENGAPVFVFSTIKRDGGGSIEERVYLEGGEIVKWLSTDPSFVVHNEDRSGMMERIGEEAARFTAALEGGATEGTGAVEGVFTGIEQGDYAHWKLRGSDGTAHSFFILQTNDAIDRVLADPQEYEGRSCRVRWERRSENLPEAGGPVEIEVLLGVEWL